MSDIVEDVGDYKCSLQFWRERQSASQAEGQVSDANRVNVSIARLAQLVNGIEYAEEAHAL